MLAFGITLLASAFFFGKMGLYVGGAGAAVILMASYGWAYEQP